MSKELKVLWLSQEEVIKAGANDIRYIMDAVERVNKMYGRGETKEADLIHLLWDDTNDSGKRMGIHGCIINSDTENVHVAGVKSIPSNPDNPSKLGMPRNNGMVILYDEDTIYPYCVLEEGLISNMRTGIGAGLGAKYLANQDSEVMGLIGTGPIANFAFEATYINVPNLKKVKVYDIRRENAERFCKKWEHTGLTFEIVDNAEAAVRDVDVLEVITISKDGDEYIKPEWLKKGAYVCEISCWDLMQDCFKIPGVKYGMDMREGRLEYPDSSNICKAVALGNAKRENCFTLAEIMNGKAAGRTSHDDIVLYYTLGMCITDVACSYWVYQKAKEMGLGTEVELWHEPRMGL